MSTLLFGKLVFSKPLTHEMLAELGFGLVDLAQAERFGIQLSCNIVQQQVYATLGCSKVPTGSEMPFLLTESPVMDVSDGIADKYAPEYPPVEPHGPLRQRLERVQRFLERASELGSIRQFVVIISESFDEHYDEELIDVHRFAERAERWYEDVSVAPNVRFIIDVQGGAA